MDFHRTKIALLVAVITGFSLIAETSCCGRILLRSGLASESDKQIILDTHNALRQLVALGQIPGHPQAANLQEMTWDDDLARRAQQWSSSCYAERHDENRHNRRFPVGQNIATIWTTRRPSSEYEISPDFMDAIKRWFDEYRNYQFGRIFYSDDTTGHYTQMVWANTNSVGCGFSFYYDPAKGFTKNYICNYGPSGNVISQRPYKVGSPSCSAFRMQSSQRYYGLCGRFPVGQNIATIWTTRRPSSEYEISPDFMDAIKRWFDEYRNYQFGRIFYSDDTTGHYTQMVWANTNSVGCGFSFYYDPAKGFTKNYICNYGRSGNVIRERLYKVGSPSCSAFRMQPSQRYYGLCEKSRGYFYDLPIRSNDLIEYIERILR